jgi:hypothetical protein
MNTPCRIQDAGFLVAAELFQPGVPGRDTGLRQAAGTAAISRYALVSGGAPFMPQEPGASAPRLMKICSALTPVDQFAVGGLPRICGENVIWLRQSNDFVTGKRPDLDARAPNTRSGARRQYCVELKFTVRPIRPRQQTGRRPLTGTMPQPRRRRH